MTMIARVNQAQKESLWVWDLQMCQEVVVHTPRAGCFRPHDMVRIEYNGVMTASIPPQISAIQITRIPKAGCG